MANNTPESGVDEGNEKISKKNIDKRKTFINNYFNSLDPKEKFTFLDSFKNEKYVNGNIKSGFELYLIKNKDKYIGIDISEISIIDLKKILARDISELSGKRLGLKKHLMSEYDNLDERTLIGEIEKKDINELTELIKNKKMRHEFLGPFFEKNKGIEESIKVSFFDKLDFSEQEKQKILELDEQNQGSILPILKELNGRNKAISLGSTDVNAFVDLLKLDFLDIDFKKQVISDFLPIVSIYDAKNIGILTVKDVDKEKRKKIEESYDRSYIHDVGLQNLVDSLKEESNYIDTKDYLSAENVTKIIDQNFLSRKIVENFSDSFNNSLDIIKNRVLETGPQNINELIVGLEQINTNQRFKGLEKFRKGNVIKYITKDKEGNQQISYLKIVSENEEKKAFGTRPIGQGNKIGKNNNSALTVKTYFEFLDILKEPSIELEFFTTKEIDEQIKDPTNALENIGFELYTLDDLEDLNHRKALEKKYVEKLKGEIEDLEKKGEMSGKDDESKKLLAQYKRRLELLGTESNNEKFLNFINLQKLIKSLDGLDPEGKKYGFEKGTFIETKEGSFEVTGIDEEKSEIRLSSIAGEESLPFSIFLDSFEQNNAYRVKNIDNFETLIQGEKGDNKKWENHEFIDGKFIAKSVQDGSKKVDKTVKYLTSTKSDTVLEICSINGNNVAVKVGSRKNIGDLEDDEKKKYKKDEKGEILYIKGADKKTISLNELSQFIKKEELDPNWKTGKTHEPEAVKDLHEDIKGSFSSRLFSRISIAEALAGGKMMFDSLEETLKKGNDLHAAKVALGMGKFLPEEIRAELEIKVERAEGDEMDKELEGLGKVDSPIATKRILGWLKNSDTPEAKKEAGLMFMLSKYGVLYAKKLEEYRGEFLWYQAFGGRIGDELYLEIKAQAEESDVTFSEETLMHILVNRQCKNKLKPKRRSRLHKEYEGKWKGGIDEEFEKGYKDANNKRTATDMVRGGMEEAVDGTIPNAIGWFKKAIERGGTLEEMSEGFFSLLYSGALYNVDQATFLKIKGLWDGEGMPLIMTRFSTKKSDMVLFNKVVLDVSLRMQDIYPELDGIGKAAQSLFNRAQKGDGKEGDRIKETQNFWKKYGTPLSRALNFSNNDDPTYAKTDKLIFLEQDKNKNFKKYYEDVQGFTTEGTFKKDFMDDACGVVGLTGLNTNQLAKQYLKLSPGGQLIEESVGAKVWTEFMKDIDSIPMKDFHEDGDKNLEQKRRYLQKFLRDLFSAFLSNHAGNALSYYNKSTSEIGQVLQYWSVDLMRDLDGMSSSDISEGKKGTELINRVINKILSGSTSGGPSFQNPLDKVISGSKQAANDAMVDPLMVA
ncbi:hypothetical protein A9Q91_02320 [Candidatus Gracilibacteria bacterium 28_42_T64]|nr:hypothetical protein A9Q91_02320 [Candidatus Gracilibacteria bacterium 28_42_T64]